MDRLGAALGELWTILEQHLASCGPLGSSTWQVSCGPFGSCTWRVVDHLGAALGELVADRLGAALGELLTVWEQRLASY